MLKKGDTIVLIENEVEEYIENNYSKLCGDEKRSLSVEDYSLYYFVCEFNDGTSLIHETIKPESINPDDYEEGEEVYKSSLMVPTNIFKKAEIQIQPIYNIEIPVKGLTPDANGIYNKDEYINTSKRIIHKLLEETENIRKMEDNIVNTINNIVIANALNKEIPIGQEIRLEYEMDVISILTKYSFASLFAYAFDNNKETLIKKEGSHYPWLFDSKMIINEIIKDTMFVIRNKDRHQDEYTMDGYILTNCELKLGFNKNEKGELLFIVKFKKTEELMNYINN